MYAACNSGSSAVGRQVVSNGGEVFMFGKDTYHCDHATGQVTELKDVNITQIALGKAHAIALSSKGQIYSYGINNKGQCGRDYNPGATREGSNNVNMAEEEEEAETEEFLCPPGKHRWKHDQCMVCVVCGECTGYGSSCVNSGKPDRQPGSQCGCGVGDAGCVLCGVCSLCGGDKLDLDGLDERGLFEVFAKGKESSPLDILISRHEVRHIEQLSRKVEQQHMKVRKAHQKLIKEKKQRGDDGDQEKEYTKLVSLLPAEVVIGNGDILVSQIACGQHHTVVLLQNGDVYTFGSNHQGQLGQGDLHIRGCPAKVTLPTQLSR
ncbi:E3 ubiquitin-protein ligase MYCBP2-like [Gigantopelta aegis]|uniref:E3 ubiquitin-protein ligase MYCBP2-like n=1 Tax=Gigantopelta aegis TaxID=1735272 RepID=UPI001B889DFC|nr:E3 ubiquitin-protein ligase MYCBP2-like [Gigantopelta aegis]